MKIVIGADHAGYEMKEGLKPHISELGHSVVDIGTNQPGIPDDYPDFAELVAKELQAGRADRVS